MIETREELPVDDPSPGDLFRQDVPLDGGSDPRRPRRWQIHVRGVVQGIGFRPFVYRVARDWRLQGWVKNGPDGVLIEVEGPPEQLEQFWQDFWRRLPPGAFFDEWQRREIPCLGTAEPSQFRILPSGGEGPRQPNIPPDLATCPECLKELWDPADRRFRYPFINCTHCGPRWSIIEGVPYDRPLTSMKHFAMCEACAAEYHDPGNRRFHAQPIACPDCGPQLQLLSPWGSTLGEGDQALRGAAQAICDGNILALKGLGGFQLVCDATNQQAVQRLRERKRRPHKPFALMMNQSMLSEFLQVPSPAAAWWLRSAAAPIILQPRNRLANHETAHPAHQPRQIAPAVAPDNPYLGVMLPYTPLHHLLLEAVGRPLVCTSGNISEEPMAIDNAEALQRLADIADLFLVHNRAIVRPVDDSVAGVDDWGEVFLVRRARGFAPRPIRLPGSATVILATGGHLKNVVGLGLESQAVLSAHIGDLDNPLAYAAHRRAIEDLLRFFQAVPQAVACDLHPDYASTRTAEAWASQLHAPLFRWQHHVAHFAAALAEWESATPGLAPLAPLLQASTSSADRADAPPATEGGRDPLASPPPLQLPVLGAIWDGTGYGVDGTVWGGEFFLFDGQTFHRVACLRPFPLPGGDAAVREPRRSLLGLLYEADYSDRDRLLEGLFDGQQYLLLQRAIARGIHSPRTSSMGRLFDGVAALLGLAARTTFEGQAAMALQFAAERAWDAKIARRTGDIGPDNAFDATHNGIRQLPPAASADPTRYLMQNTVVRRAILELLEELTQHPEAERAAEFLVKRQGRAQELLSQPPSDMKPGQPWQLDWQPILASLIAAAHAGASAESLALDFHLRLVEAIFKLYAAFGCRSLVVSGGCFQNQLLRTLVSAQAARQGVPLFQPRLVPPGDGGITLGQLWLTARALATGNPPF